MSARYDAVAFRIEEILPKARSYSPRLLGRHRTHAVGEQWLEAAKPEVGGYITFDTDDPNGRYVPVLEYLRNYSVASMVEEELEYGYIDTMADILMNVLAVGNFHLRRRVDLRIGQGVAEQLGAPAMTLFPDDGSDPVIYIDGDVPYVACAELLAHELAHVLFPDDDHGETWKAACDMIWEDAFTLSMRATGHKPLGSELGASS